MGKLGDSLDQAVAKAFTRPAPKSAQAQMKYLAKQLKSTKAVAEALGVSQPTVERYVTGKLKRPRKDLAARLEREVCKRWQPQIRAKAKKAAATSGGLVIETRARFGYTAAAGTTDDGRMRHLTQDLPPAPTPPASSKPRSKGRPRSSSRPSRPRGSRRSTSRTAAAARAVSSSSSPTYRRSRSPCSSPPRTRSLNHV